MVWFDWKRKGKTTWGATSTAQQVAKDWDGKGKVAIITGAFSGIGMETARVLASKGCEVILAGRGAERGERAANEVILQSQPEAKVRVMHLDLASFQSVRDFADDFLSLGLPLHILINNAGVMGGPFTLSEDGYELQFATNHLGHFLLTKLLLNCIIESCPVGSHIEGRIVTVSSEFHRYGYKEGILSEDKLQDKRVYDPMEAYGQSKLANILFAQELERRLRKRKDAGNIRSFSLHPGIVRTNILMSNLTVKNQNTRRSQVITLLASKKPKTLESGSATTLVCATSNEAVPGYYKDCQRSTTKNLNKNIAVDLWNLSEKLVM